MAFRLHNFFRSSTSTRLRAALNLKGLEYDYVAYVLRNGETQTPGYLARNPQGLVPTLELDNSTNLTQSLAIIEYLEDIHPKPALLPRDPVLKAKVKGNADKFKWELSTIKGLTDFIKDLPQRAISPLKRLFE